MRTSYDDGVPESVRRCPGRCLRSLGVEIDDEGPESLDGQRGREAHRVVVFPTPPFWSAM